MGVEKMVAVGMETSKGLLIDALLRRPLEMVPVQIMFLILSFSPDTFVLRLEMMPFY